ncbi:sulfite exporter TauE/SafE family protein [Candidatus Sumerlaeota bacterium]|nr:sulfite exporter TauE/SafE family protein [Candidatus Sumerlaeota bacterium]
MLSAFFGVGGGALLVPALIGLFGLSWPAANALSLTQMIPTSASGALGHYRNGNVNVRLAMMTLVGAIPGAWIGHAVVKWLEARGTVEIGGYEVNLLTTVLTWCFALTIIYMSARMMGEKQTDSLRRARGNGGEMTTRDWFSAALLGLVVGISSAMLGIGGGFLFVPLSIRLFNLPVVIAVGTSLMQMPVTAATGAVSYLMSTEIPWSWLVPLLIGSLTGVQGGVYLSRQFDNKQYKRILAGLLILICVYMIGKWMRELSPVG